MYNNVFFAQKNIDELKKQAEKAFNEENYVDSYQLFSQLVANFSKEPIYNYKLGVSMIYAESDKKKCIPYLEFAARFVQKKEVPPEALFYLAKAYHINYRFNDAIKYYKEYKQNVSSSKAKGMQVDREILSCENGKKLLSNIKELVVISKKRLNETEYFRSYDLSTSGGKFLIKPDAFQTKLDKKKKDKSIVFLPQQGDKIFFSSYGEDGKNGKDIYFAIRLPNGTFANPQLLTAINTPFDEDYPFLHPNGKVLYFASKGYNSMGGYDIFKSKFDETTQTWTKPENLEFPINSPDDDFLFVTDSSEKTAFFSTSRYSPPGKIDVLKIKTERVAPLLVAIKGNVRKTEINQSVRSLIAVKNIETGELVGTFAANDNGEYYMELPNGGKFFFTVETPGFTKQSEAVNLPLSYVIKPFRQSISYEKNVLIITNYFDEAGKEDSYLDMVEYIEKKAQLDANEEQFKQNSQQTTAVNNNTNTTNENTTENKNNELSASNTPIPPNNTNELIEIVKNDVNELNNEIQQLNTENQQLNQVLQLKNQELNELDKNIQDTQNQLNAADTQEEKEQLTQLLNDLQEKKKNTSEQKQFFEQYQKELLTNVENKKKESEINQQFLNTLNDLNNSKNNKATLNKLEILQKQLQTIEQQKKEKSDAQLSLNQQENEKKQELSKLQQQKNNLEKDAQLIQDKISNLKNEISSTKDKTLIENIQTQINEKEKGLKEKQNQIVALNNKIEDVNDDLQSIQEQKNLIAKIKNNEPVQISKNNERNNPHNNLINNSNINPINSEFTNKINNSSNDIEKTKNIEEYNKILMKSIEENKKQISKTSNASEKQKLINLNSELEQVLKSNNDQLIALKNKTNNNQTNIANNNQNPPNNNQNNIANNNQNPPNNRSNFININNQQAIIQNVKSNEQAKSEFISLKKQFENQNYQSPTTHQFKQNIPDIPVENPISQNLTNIINAQQQINFFNQQKDSLRKIANELKNQAHKTTDNNKKQKLLNDAKKTDIAALEKEYQATQFTKTLHQNTFQLYENTFNQLPENQKQQLNSEINKAKQNFKQAEQIRKEAANQSNLTIKIANEQNAQEKEQIALANLSNLFKQNNIILPPNNYEENLKQENKQIQNNFTQLQKKYIHANQSEINYLLSIADTSQKIKNNPNTQQSLNQLKEIQKNIDNQIKDSSITSKETDNTIINNQLQLLQQLRQITSTTLPADISKNNYLKNQTNLNTTISSDTANTVLQNLPINISSNANQQIQSLIQEQQQIKDNLKTDNPIIKPKDEIIKENEKINTEITQLTNKALDLKQKISQTTDQRKKSELQTEFDRTNSTIQEKKLIQISNELLVNQADYTSQNKLLNELYNSIPNNKSVEKNTFSPSMNEIQKLKKQEETLIQEALKITNPSAQLGALQNAKIKQQEYLQAQQQLTNQLQKYSPDVKLQSSSVNINDPLILSVKYQSNIQKQIKEWESVNNNLNMEITRMYPKYSTTPSGKILADAQKLITEAKNTTDINKKLELQIKAAQLQQKALQQLSATSTSIANNQQPPNNNQQNIAQNNKQPENKNNQQNIAQNNKQPENKNNQQNIAQNNKQPENKNNQPTTNNFLPQIKSVKISKTPAYSNANPIPLNPALPDGLIFSVQVGAFKNPLPNNFFNGINPVFSQTTDNKLYRYLIGQMEDPQEAMALKNNFRNLGYTDAFVIAYYNGKRISLSEALELLIKQKNQNIAINPFATTNVLEKANIPTYTTLLQSTQQNITTANTAVIKNAEEINDLYFTIQIGVYKKDISDAALKYIQPIIRSTINDKFFRYSAGIYDNITQAQKDLNKVIALGMKDAFICAYWNGKRYFYPEAEKLIRTNKNIRYAPPQYIIFPNEAVAQAFDLTSNNPSVKNAIIDQNNSKPFDPTLVFTNGISKKPEPTPENGVKSDDSGICFRVQIGAFKNKVPAATAEKYFKIKNWPIEVHYLNDLYIYTTGNFISAKYAAKLRDEMIKLGINDAFITVYKDNKKLFGYEALKYMKE